MVARELDSTSGSPACDGNDIDVRPSVVVQRDGLAVGSRACPVRAQGGPDALKNDTRKLILDVFAVVQRDDDVQVGVAAQGRVFWNGAGAECLQDGELVLEEFDDPVAPFVRRVAMIAAQIDRLIKCVAPCFDRVCHRCMLPWGRVWLDYILMQPKRV
jgi:hypothetical protein